MAAPAAATAAAADIPRFRPLPRKEHLNADDAADEYKMYAVAPLPPKRDGWTRVWVDGCFDMLHFGHTNALRQARGLGPEGKTELFVGCHSDEEICKVKGPPIMKEDERYEALRACKWVDYAVENYPYSTRLKDMVRFQVDFVAHGDDVSVGADGRNSYQEIIDAGKFQVFKRTDGISTTDLVGRMLLCTKNHMVHTPSDDLSKGAEDHVTKLSYFTTSRKIVQFSNNTSPQPHHKIVYVCGGFDLFHIGHMRVLQLAREICPFAYVIAGICDDKEVNRHKSSTNYPIMNLNERVLGVLSCKYVDEVVMGVPFAVTDEIIDKLGVHFVVGGATRDPPDPEHHPVEPDYYAAAKRRGIFRPVDGGCILTTSSLIDRIMEQRQAFLDRQKKKVVKDKASMDNRPAEYRNVREV